jgi:hypothetical protein
VNRENRERRENIFCLERMLFFFFFALCEIFSKIFFVRDTKRESFQQQQRKKFKNEKRARERERKPIISFPHNNLLYISFFCALTMETMNTTTTTNKREGDEKDFEEEEDKKRVKKDELEEDELETQETHPWSANEEILEEEVYVQDLGKVSDDVKVVEAEKTSWNRKPLARPIDGQTDSIRAF